MAERFPWPFPLPLPGRDPPGDRVYRDPEGNPLNEPGEPVDPRDLLPPFGPEVDEPPDDDVLPEDVLPELPGDVIDPGDPDPGGEDPPPFRVYPDRLPPPAYRITSTGVDRLPPALQPAQRLRAGLIDSRPAKPARPRALEGIGVVERALGPTILGPPRSRRPKSRTRGFEVAPVRLPRLPPPRAPQRRGAEVPRVDVFEIMRQSREARERERRRREDLFRRGIPPVPTPDETAPYPVEPIPRRRTFPQPARPIEVPVPTIPAPSAPPAPRIPDRVPQPPALPVPAPSSIPRTRKPAGSRPRARPARARVPRALTRVAQVAALAILRPILRRNSVARPELLRAREARIDNPIEERLQPEATTPGLTPINTPSVGLQPIAALTPQGFRSQRRQRDCECEPTEEEKEDERERSRSNVVAKVKSFSRRMSQNSLDNLKRGF